jgi:DNA-binding NarL/FixJ family response regulator
MTPLRGSTPVRVVIADDRLRTRRALRALLATCPGLEVAGEAADGEEAIACVERLQPDVVLLDVWMPRLNGIAATARVKARWPSVRVVVHSLTTERRDEALAAGADAFVCKGADARELLSALRAPADAS